MSYVMDNSQLIFRLAKDDLKMRFSGSQLGVIWGFVQPFVTIVLYWFVFQVGFRGGKINDTVPYILWLVAGIVPWFFFSESWVGATAVMYEYSFLVKKVVFNIQILPIVKIVSALFIHIFFIAMVFVMLLIYGFPLSIYNIQIMYYLFSELLLLYALSLITSSLAVFVKDVIQVISILLQVFFWMIPIVWNPAMIDQEWLIRLLKLNPIYYIVEGYRNSLIDRIAFWEKPLYSLYYWGVVIFILAVGVWMNKRLKPHFADLL